MEKLGGIFNASSPEMTAMAGLTFYMIATAIAILAIIVVAVAYIIIRYRKTPGDDGEPQQDFGSVKVEIIWTVIPALIVAVLFFLTVKTMLAVDPPKGDRKPDIVIIGHQWWWEFYYPNSGVLTANELHIPVGEKWLARLESVDVIHDFWVPELFRKIDLVPGHPNHIWLVAGKPGTFLGACAEFCGAQHANMRIRVIAQTREEFDAWEKEQLKIPKTPTSGEAAKGEKLFMTDACMNCHTVRGTAAAARVGPDLTHLNTRETIGAGVLINTPENLKKWLLNPQAYKPGALMPNMKLSEDQANQIVAYLEALK
ncbi:MAG: cytochrome c oxidase subunit II [Deltaproteobacteria bacterium]|nr:cytochrome c oxidase subunit II [Deltaproteobacteria bacterium]